MSLHASKDDTGIPQAMVEVKQSEQVGSSLTRQCGTAGWAPGRVLYAGEEIELGLRWKEVGVEDGGVIDVEWMWQLFTGVLRGHSNLVTSVASLGDGRFASGSYDNTVRVWAADGDRCSMLDDRCSMPL